MVLVLICAILSACVQKVVSYFGKELSLDSQHLQSESVCVIIAIAPGLPCEATVREVLGNAKAPQTLRLHVSKGMKATELNPNLAPNDRLATNLIIQRTRNYDESVEIAHMVHDYFGGERFLCILPGDVQLSVGWDVTLKSMLRSCKADLPIITTVPPSPGTSGATFTRAVSCGSNGAVRIEAAPFAETPARPQPVPFLYSRFLFAPGLAAGLFPPTNQLRVDIADTVVGRMLWTLGCDFFAPHKTVCWCESAHHRPVGPALKVSKASIRDDAMRTFEEYDTFCGIRMNVLSRRARLGLTPKALPLECIAKYATDAPLIAFNSQIKENANHA